MDYVPAPADIVWISFSPQTGHEQAGYRPALVLSPKAYNAIVGLALFSPITTQVKGYPFEVTIPKGLEVVGVILSDQIKSLDWKARKVKFICKLPVEQYYEVVQKLYTIIPQQN